MCAVKRCRVFWRLSNSLIDDNDVQSFESIKPVETGSIQRYGRLFPALNLSLNRSRDLCLSHQWQFRETTHTLECLRSSHAVTCM
jgi:hypothetical protein